MMEQSSLSNGLKVMSNNCVSDVSSAAYATSDIRSGNLSFFSGNSPLFMHGHGWHSNPPGESSTRLCT